MGTSQVKAHCQLASNASGYIKHAMEEMNFSARGHNRILKVARTLAGSESIAPPTRWRRSNSARWTGS
jgi:predicted ATPase with chaperone activity